MTHEYLLWIATFAYSLHAFEEFELNWRDWARNILRLPVDWTSFYLANSIVVILGVCCASVGWRAPWFALALPALMLINATFFHLLPTLVTRVYSPGLATALLFFYPLGIGCYYGAHRDGILTLTQSLLSFLAGAAIMASPIILLKIKSWPMFTYSSR